MVESGVVYMQKSDKLEFRVVRLSISIRGLVVEYYAADRPVAAVKPMQQLVANGKMRACGDAGLQFLL